MDLRKLTPASDTSDLSQELKSLEQTDWKPICWSCFGMSSEAVQTPHGCVLCSKCRRESLEKVWKSGQKVPCPSKNCQDLELRAEDLQSPQVSYRQKIESIQFQCPNNFKGCEKILKVGEIEDHLTLSCEVQDLPCKFCRQELPKKLLDDHENYKCVERLVKCGKCDLDICAKDLKKHSDLLNANCCSELEDLCPFCQEEVVSKTKMKQHFKEVCSKKPRACRFYVTGCSFFDVAEKVSEHEEASTSIKEHLSLLLLHKTALETEIKKLQEVCQQQNLEMQKMRQKVAEDELKVKKQLTALTEDVSRQEWMLKEVGDTSEQLSRTVEALEEELLNSAVLELWGGFNTRCVGACSLWKVSDIEYCCLRLKEVWSPVMRTPRGYGFRLSLHFGVEDVNLHLYLSPAQQDLPWPCKTSFLLKFADPESPLDKSGAFTVVQSDLAHPDDSINFQEAPVDDICVNNHDNYLQMSKKVLLNNFTRQDTALVTITAQEEPFS